jgi:hypothetical protein
VPVDAVQPETLANTVARSIPRLAFGAAIWFGYTVLAMIGGFFGSMSAGSALFGLVWVPAIVAIVWAAGPVVDFFGRI